MSEQKLSILIVDDEQVVRDSLVHWFTEEGYDLDSASNANDALAKLAGREFDLVIADIRMPGMDGIGLLEKIQSEQLDTSVIVMTGYASVETAIRALIQSAQGSPGRALGQLRSGHPGRMRQLVSGGIEHQFDHVQVVGHGVNGGLYELPEATRRHTSEFRQRIGPSRRKRWQHPKWDTPLFRIGWLGPRRGQLRQQPEVSKGSGCV